MTSSKVKVPRETWQEYAENSIIQPIRKSSQPYFWHNGKLDNDIRVPLLSHSLHYGSSVFEGMRFYATPKGSAVFRLDDHITRFFHSIQAIGASSPYSHSQIKQAVKDTIRSNNYIEGYIRPLGFFGDGDMELNPNPDIFQIAIAVWPWAARLGVDPITVTISPFTRTSSSSTITTAKISGHYANSILSRQEAKKRGFKEALLLDPFGNIAEGPGANFFAVKDGVLITPTPKHIFPGLTRETILQLAKDSQIPVEIRDILPSELATFDEAFFSGTALGILPIGSVDAILFKHPFGPIAKLLKDRYVQITHGNDESYDHWLTYVNE